jgi:hypothetical protein
MAVPFCLYDYNNIAYRKKPASYLRRSQVDWHASRESGRSIHYENAVDDHDTNYDQRQQQAGRFVPRHCAFHQKHQLELEGETRHGGQQQRVRGLVWRSSCGAHMQFFYSGVGIFNWYYLSSPPQIPRTPAVPLESK